MIENYKVYKYSQITFSFSNNTNEIIFISTSLLSKPKRYVAHFEKQINTKRILSVE